MAGFVNIGLPTYRDIEAIKFDSGANIEWVGIYSGVSGEGGGVATQSQDGGYLLCGYSDSYGDNSKISPIVLKINSTGQMMWSKLVGGFSDSSNPFTIAESRDSSRDIYIGGYTAAFGISNVSDALVVKLN